MLSGKLSHRTLNGLSPGHTAILLALLMSAGRGAFSPQTPAGSLEGGVSHTGRSSNHATTPRRAADPSTVPSTTGRTTEGEVAGATTRNGWPAGVAAQKGKKGNPPK